MTIAEGKKFKDRSTGEIYRVRKFENGIVILEAENTINRFCIGEILLDLFLEQISN